MDKEPNSMRFYDFLSSIGDLSPKAQVLIAAGLLGLSILFCHIVVASSH